MIARDNVRKWMIADNADELLDAFVHELAEKIRTAYSGDSYDDSWVSNPFDAADLIDPEVEK